MRVKVIWSLPLVSKIHKLWFLPSRGDDLEVKARGMLEVALVVGLGLIWDCCNKPMRLWYYSWVKPKDLEFEDPATEESWLVLESSETWGCGAFLLVLNPGGYSCLIKQVSAVWLFLSQWVQTWFLTRGGPHRFPFWLDLRSISHEWYRCRRIIRGVSWR